MMSPAGEAARIFLKRGVKNVIITLGKKGAYFQNENVSLRINAPVVTAIDTTAAGDTFSGALAVAPYRKDELGRSDKICSSGRLHFGNAIGCAGFNSLPV
jgi:ribokinase